MDKLYVVSIRTHEDTKGNMEFNLCSREDHYFKDLKKAERYFALKYHGASYKAFNEGPIIEENSTLDMYYYVVYEDPGTKNFVMITVMLSIRLFED